MWKALACAAAAAGLLVDALAYAQLTEAQLAPHRAAPSCKFKKGAWPRQTLGVDVTGARNRRTGAWLTPTEIPIQKVVVLMLENRSFDHYLGRLPQYLQARFPSHPGARPGGLAVPPPGASNPVDLADPNSKRVPWHHATQMCHSDTNHEWWGVHFQWNGGKMDGFYQSNHGFWEKNEPIVPHSLLGGERAMSYYDERDLPFYYQLAATFAIGDRYHSSLLGPTWPNRNFLYGGTSRGLTYNTAAEVKGDFPRDLRRQPSIVFDQLTAGNVLYRIYIDGDPLTSRAARIGSFTGPIGLMRRFYPNLDERVRQFFGWLEGVKVKVEKTVSAVFQLLKSLRFAAAFALVRATVAEAQSWIQTVVRSAVGALRQNAFVARVRAALQRFRESWRKWSIFNPASGAKLVYDALVYLRDAVLGALRAVDIVVRGPTASMKRFFEDAAKGQLPPVTFIDPNVREDVNSTDEHPPADVQIGQRFTWQIVQALMKSPDWQRTALFITYDEHGGYYDHAPPPAACAPDETTGDPNRITSVHPGAGGIKFGGHGGPLDVKFPGAFDRLGVRVPFIVVSPWAKKHYVSHRVYDHTSILRFIQAKFNLPALSNRDANAEPPYDLFDFTNHDNASRAPSADVRAEAFTMPPVDQAALAACRAAFPPAKFSLSLQGLRAIIPNSIAENPFKVSSFANDYKMAERVCPKLQPGVCVWGRKVDGVMPESKPHHALPVLGQ